MPIRLTWTAPPKQDAVRLRLTTGEVLAPVCGLAALPPGLSGEQLVLFVESVRRDRFDIATLVSGGHFDRAKSLCRYRDGVVYL